MRNLIESLIKEKKEERNKIANSNLQIEQIEQKIKSLNYEIKALERRL